MFNVFLSDHTPFNISTDKITVFSLNIMFKMHYNASKKFYNNGFRCEEETVDQYRSRLTQIALEVSGNINANKTSIFCFQECPQNRRDEHFFFSQLIENNKTFALEHSNGCSRGYFLTTFYDVDRFQADYALSDRIQKIPLSGGLNGRMLALSLEDRKSREKYLVINVHANFNIEIKTDIENIYAESKRFGIHYILFIGDFNRNLLITTQDPDNCQRVFSEAYQRGDFNDLKALSIERSCVYHSDAGLEIQTRDGAIMSKSLGNISTLTLWDRNKMTLIRDPAVTGHYSHKALVTSEILSAIELAHQLNNTNHEEKEEGDSKRICIRVPRIGFPAQFFYSPNSQDSTASLISNVNVPSAASVFEI